MTNPAWIIENPTVIIGPDPDDTGDTAHTVTCDLTNAQITNAVNLVDTGTLCGPAQMPGKILYTLELDGYQNWTGVDAAANYLWEHRRKTVPFVLIPKNEAVSADNPAFTGEMVCVPPEVGGTREEAALFTCACPIVGEPLKSDTWVPTGFAAGSSAKSTPEMANT